MVFAFFLVGAKPDVLRRARAEIMPRHPRLKLVGSRDGYSTAEEDAAVAAEVRRAHPDILFVAISSPCSAGSAAMNATSTSRS